VNSLWITRMHLRMELSGANIPEIWGQQPHLRQGRNSRPQGRWPIIRPAQQVEAGVARPTVFAAVGPKPTLLKLVVDYATTGDDAHIPVAERTWSREALEAEDPAMSLRLHARNSRRICGRVADLLWAVESAAAADADAAALWADLQEQRRTSMRTYVRALARKTELREDVATITDSMWAMIPALYLRLVRDAGWSPDRFETWLGETFIQLWLP